MNKNFAGQTFNNQSFRGQDLAGADFSHCVLNSCDFKEADLTGARFCATQMGVSLRWKIAKGLLSFSFGTVAGLLCMILNWAFYASVIELQKVYLSTDVPNEQLALIVTLLCAFGLCYFVYGLVNYRNWRFAADYIMGTVIIMLALALALVGAVALGAVVTAVTVTVLAVAVAVAGTEAEAVAGTVAGTVAVVVAVAVAVAGTVAVSVAVMTLMFLLLGVYLHRRAIQDEDSMLAPLRRYALLRSCWQGTEFAGAILTQSDFTAADLKYARFSDATFHHPSFHQAKNLHLAWTVKSPLENRSVRQLLTDGRVGDGNFSYVPLRGLSLTGLKLNSCNFYHADLSDADFSDCDLTGADLSEAMVLGTRFNGATLTGAIIDCWSMDQQTQFEGVICEFVITDRDKQERNPPQGQFKPGEFTKLYQEIANTIDFIAHTPNELEALLRAIQSIKQQGGDIVIQSLERKNDSVVVRTQSHDAIDKASLYAEIKEQQAQELLLLQQEVKHLTQQIESKEQQIDTFTHIIFKTLERPITMNDNSRHYGNISAQHAAINLGDHSSVSNQIEQVADPELKSALQALQQSFDKSDLSAAVKELAQANIAHLAEASHKPAVERKSLARKSLDALKDLSTLIKAGTDLGELIAKISLWF
jgi:uncharacterized protein YjbI with pentapeptide repeats